MRLCYVIHQFFPDCHSGTEQYCLWMAQEARRRGDDVTVVSLHWDHDRDWPLVNVFEQPYEGIRVVRINHWRRLNPNDVLRDYENLHLEGHFRRVLEDVRPDAVHFFHLRQLGSNLIPVAKASGARVVVSLTDFWFLCPRFTLQKSDGSLCNGPPQEGLGCVACAHPELLHATPEPSRASLRDSEDSRLRALLDRKAANLANLRLADAVFAPSQFLLSTFVQNGFPRDRIEALPYGLAPDRVAAIAVQRPRKPLRIAFCGVLSPWKAPHLVIDAVRASSADVALSIHGRVDEPMFQGYIDDCRARAAGDPRITFCGPYRHEDAGRVFADMDALVVPSVWYENTPFVVLEAFMASVPVIASDLGGLSESVRDGENGLLFRAGDAASLRAAIERMAGDPDLCARLRPKAPPTVADGYERFRRAYGQR